jgi:phosphoribosylanthranilate isomerase
VHDPVARGGTGRTIDDRRRGGRGHAADRAGGRTDGGERGEAVAQVRPFGIDVSSGVERAPGVKDPQRLRALFEALHGSPARS